MASVHFDGMSLNERMASVYLLRSSTSERKQLIFHGFIGAINDGFLTNHGALSILIILSKLDDNNFQLLPSNIS